jgi:hypothetical protein
MIKVNSLMALHQHDRHSEKKEEMEKKRDIFPINKQRKSIKIRENVRVKFCCRGWESKKNIILLCLWNCGGYWKKLCNV